MRSYFAILVQFIFVAILSSCSTKSPTKAELKSELLDHKKKLLADLVAHYNRPEDTLKVKAAKYLLDNMLVRRYYDGVQLAHYMNYGKLVLRDLDQGAVILNSFQQKYGRFSEGELTVKYDLLETTTDEIVKNIDWSFKVWNIVPWRTHYSFDQFCEYVLPFRIDNEIPGNNRDSIYRRYQNLLQPILKNKNVDAVAACNIINEKLKKEGWVLSGRVGFLPHSSASKLVKYRIGTCGDMSDLGIYVMRSMGIPVAQDIILQWPYRNIGHSWNVLLNKEGKKIMFLAAEDSPGVPHKPLTKKGKVYRNCYRVNKESLEIVKEDQEIIPGFFNSANIIDVSQEYFKGYDIAVETKQVPKAAHVYLSVFNNREWVPIGWAKNKDGVGSFKHFEPGIVYLPTTFSQEGNQPFGEPFLLDDNGTKKELRANVNQLSRKITLDRLYPNTPEMYMVDDATEGEIQGANNPDFKNATVLYSFKNRALPYWNKIEITEGQEFRYIRFIPAKNKRCNVAELQIFHERNRMRVKPIVLGNKNDSNLHFAFDNDLNTSYSSEGLGESLACDLGRKMKIDEIQFASKIAVGDDMKVSLGQIYELQIWRNGTFSKFAEATAEEEKISFEQVPSNGLYLLHNKLKRVDERIFVLKNGKQIFY
jgi:hypothetical protein